MFPIQIAPKDVFVRREHRSAMDARKSHGPGFRVRYSALVATIAVLGLFLLAAHSALARDHGGGDRERSELWSRIEALEAALKSLQEALIAEKLRAKAAEAA